MKRLMTALVFTFCFILLASCGGSRNPAEPISTKATINITLGAVAFLLFVAFIFTTRIIKFLAFIGMSAILVSILFYWRAGLFLSELTEIEVWARAMDVSLAHVVISFTLFAGLLCIVALPFLIVIINSKESSGCLPLIAFLLWITVGVFAYKYLMIDTEDLQKILFGKNDGLLGWNFPTTFLFSNFTQQMDALYAEASANPEISPVLNSATRLVTFVLGVGGFLGVYEIIQRLFKKT